MSDAQSVTFRLNKRAKEDKPYEIQIRRDRRRKCWKHLTNAILLTFIFALVLFYISMLKNKDTQILTWVFSLVRDKMESSNALAAVGLAFGGCASLNIALAYQNNETGRRGVETSIWRQSLGGVMDSTVVFGYCVALLYLICGKDRSVPAAVMVIGVAFLTGAIGFSCQNQVTPRDRAKAYYASYKRRMELRTWKHRVARLYGIPLQDEPPARGATLIAQLKAIGLATLIGVTIPALALYLTGLRNVSIFIFVAIMSAIISAGATFMGQVLLMTEWMPGNLSGKAYLFSKWWCRIGHAAITLLLTLMTITGILGLTRQQDSAFAFAAFGGLLGISFQLWSILALTRGHRSPLFQFIARPIWYRIGRQYSASLDLHDATLKRIAQEEAHERQALSR
ncbi:hypothetical protein [Mycobacteroides abscessus]|uniref:hypothetical protein n=1 Tax=Mycobacteroides abscessus TaxID=36809 RepID=UPI000C266C15|nr:hypothetical protein [Mycobacteroides abscessus]